MILRNPITKTYALDNGSGGTVFAVEKGKGVFELQDTISPKRYSKGDAKKRKSQKQARKRQRK